MSGRVVKRAFDAGITSLVTLSTGQKVTNPDTPETDCR